MAIVRKGKQYVYIRELYVWFHIWIVVLTSAQPTVWYLIVFYFIT
jgi:hypothetical protein